MRAALLAALAVGTSAGGVRTPAPAPPHGVRGRHWKCIHDAPAAGVAQLSHLAAFNGSRAHIDYGHGARR
jgi:hypothetical protein